MELFAPAEPFWQTCAPTDALGLIAISGKNNPHVFGNSTYYRKTPFLRLVNVNHQIIIYKLALASIATNCRQPKVKVKGYLIDIIPPQYFCWWNPPPTPRQIRRVAWWGACQMWLPWSCDIRQCQAMSERLSYDDLTLLPHRESCCFFIIGKSFPFYGLNSGEWNMVFTQIYTLDLIGVWWQVVHYWETSKTWLWDFNFDELGYGPFRTNYGNHLWFETMQTK